MNHDASPTDTDSGPRRQSRGSSRQAAREGKAKTRNLYASYRHSGSEASSRSSSCDVDRRTVLDQGLQIGVTCERPRVPKIAPVLDPPFRPIPIPPPPLPTHRVSVGSGTIPMVRMSHKRSTPGPTQSASPRKKKFALQIPTQGSSSMNDASDEVDVEMDDLMPLSVEEYKSSEVSVTYKDFVVFKPFQKTESLFSQPPVYFEPPPSTDPPPSFLYDYFAKMVDTSIPD